MKLQTFNVPCAHRMAAYGGPKVEIKTVKGYEQEICGIRCIVHQNLFPGERFMVSEYTTGLGIATGRTKTLAVEQAQTKLSQHKKEWSGLFQRETNKLLALKVQVPLNS